MSVGSYELREIEWTWAHIALVVLAFLSAGLHFALATTTGDTTFAVLAVGLLAGMVLFFTDLWQPVLYLVGAVYVGMMTVVWVLAGMPLLALALVDKAVQALLFALFVYLLVTEMQAMSPPDMEGSRE
ncbi:hypothetical protein [Natronomonas amylolytica]|uniref:hypothetical protein n=1 Tax=Natronomonas amylolytica TaxID=3108498 RepID=UPI003009EE13